MAGADALAHLIQLAGLVGIMLAACFCLVAGDMPVISATILYLLAMIGSLVLQTQYAGMQYGVMAVDAAYLVALLVIALRWHRQWTLWATAFQLLSVFTHLALLSQTGPFFVEYLTLLALWSYLVMVAICVGAGMAWQRRRSVWRSTVSPTTRVSAHHRKEPAGNMNEDASVDTNP